VGIICCLVIVIILAGLKRKRGSKTITFNFVDIVMKKWTFVTVVAVLVITGIYLFNWKKQSSVSQQEPAKNETTIVEVSTAPEPANPVDLPDPQTEITPPVEKPTTRQIPSQPVKKQKTSPLYKSTSPAIEDDAFEGINVHFGQGLKGHADYTADKIQTAIAKAKEMRLNSFRCDFNIDDNGKPSTTGDMFLKAANAANMKVFAVLYIKDRGRMPADGANYTNAELDATYNRNYKAVNNFAKSYPFVKYYQLDNELDVKSVGSTGKSLINYVLNRFGAASMDDGYNMITFPMLKKQLQGMIAGIKDASSNNKCGLNYAWTHTGLIRKVLNSGITLDFVGVDPYNDEEYAKDAKGKATYGRFVGMMKEAFPDVQEHFITEMGFKPSKQNPKKLSQAGFLLPLFNSYASQCNGVFLYELENEPRARASSKDRDEAILGMEDETVKAFKNR
jgi:hypothetical protein